MVHPERDDIIAILNWLHRYATDKAKTLEQQLDGFFKLVLIHGSTIVVLDVLVTWKN